jgi:hypothetical protein
MRQRPAHSEVADEDRLLFFLTAAEKNVGWLEVPVQDLLRMQVSNRTAELIEPSHHNSLGQLRGVVAHAGYALLQVSALAEGHEQAQRSTCKVSRIRKRTKELNYVRML